MGNSMCCVKKNKSMDEAVGKKKSRRKRQVSDGSDSDYSPEAKKKIKASTSKDEAQVKKTGSKSIIKEYVSSTKTVIKPARTSSRFVQINTRTVTSKISPANVENRPLIADTRQVNVVNRPNNFDTRLPNVVNRPTISETRLPNLVNRPTISDARLTNVVNRPTISDTRLPNVVNRPTISDTRLPNVVNRPVIFDSRFPKNVDRPVISDTKATIETKSVSATNLSQRNNELASTSNFNTLPAPIKPKCYDDEEVEYMHETDDDEHDNDEIIWDEVTRLSQQENVPKQLAQNFIDLLSEGCTLPFIARYRKTTMFYMMPDKLQDMYESYQIITQLKKKVKTVLETLRKSKKLTPAIEKSVLNAHSLSELDLVYAPFKSHSLSLAEKARKLGLEPIAIRALNDEFINLDRLCTNDEELKNPDKVAGHITHIVADIMHKDLRILEKIRQLKEETKFTIQTSRTKSSTKEKEIVGKVDSGADPETYKMYFDWKCPLHFIKPHQILAMNRGEDEKILTIKVNIPDWFYNNLERFCMSLWKSQSWVKRGLLDAYNRLIKPWLSRQVRADLLAQAYKEGIDTFTTNLEKYLLTEPVKNRVIAGLDPGFKAGCKVGIINPNGDKLDACTIYPNFHHFNRNDSAAKQLKGLLNTYSVELIGLGNGTACRETEIWLKSHQISQNIPIVIVPEQGASIYSISKEAQKEHPNMDPNLISALSIARRVLDPLGELIKVDPKNLGVGLYQHSIPPKLLEAALDGTVEKIVSLVGVDINTASQAMLRRISGLNEGRAKKILAYRQDNGGFKSRAEIMKVSGIGKITFQQCAGFLKVMGGPEPLDATIIHPESYSLAKKFAIKIGVNIKHLSQPRFPAMVESKTSFINLEDTSRDLNTDVCTLELIITAFKQKSYEDNVITFCRPVYSLAVQAKEQIEDGMTLIGVVRNVVPFGCFVDCGVNENGLIHRKHLNGNQTPKLGDRVSVTVIPSIKANKIQLKLEKILD